MSTDASVLDELHKRLLALSYLGVTLSTQDGHRWIKADDGGYDNDFNLGLELKAAGYSASCKIYGSMWDALNYVDHLLGLVGHESLLDTYEKYIACDEYFFYPPIESAHYWERRVDQYEKGEGGLG